MRNALIQYATERERETREERFFFRFVMKKSRAREKQGDEGNERRDKARALITSLNGSFVRSFARERARVLALALALDAIGGVGGFRLRTKTRMRRRRRRRL